MRKCAWLSCSPRDTKAAPLRRCWSAAKRAPPSRFIAEMALDKATAKEDPREKLRALRAEFAARAAVQKA